MVRALVGRAPLPLSWMLVDGCAALELDPQSRPKPVGKVFGGGGGDASAPDPQAPFVDELAVLASMGFADAEANLVALGQHGYDLPATIDALVKGGAVCDEPTTRPSPTAAVFLSNTVSFADASGTQVVAPAPAPVFGSAAMIFGAAGGAVGGAVGGEVDPKVGAAALAATPTLNLHMSPMERARAKKLERAAAAAGSSAGSVGNKGPGSGAEPVLDKHAATVGKKQWELATCLVVKAFDNLARAPCGAGAPAFKDELFRQVVNDCFRQPWSPTAHGWRASSHARDVVVSVLCGVRRWIAEEDATVGVAAIAAGTGAAGRPTATAAAADAVAVRMLQTTTWRDVSGVLGRLTALAGRIGGADTNGIEPGTAAAAAVEDAHAVQLDALAAAAGPLAAADDATAGLEAGLASVGTALATFETADGDSLLHLGIKGPTPTLSVLLPLVHAGGGVLLERRDRDCGANDFAAGGHGRTGVETQLFVKYTNRIVSLSFDSEKLIADVKVQIQSREGLAPAQQKLLYGGKLLEDDRSLFDYNIHALSTLDLIELLRGGNGKGDQTKAPRRGVRCVFTTLPHHVTHSVVGAGETQLSLEDLECLHFTEFQRFNGKLSFKQGLAMI